MPAERRRVVDRRAGSERRSTLERRGRMRPATFESPGEHVRNALQLLTQVPLVGEAEFDAALSRLRRAIELLEQHR